MQDMSHTMKVMAIPYVDANRLQDTVNNMLLLQDCPSRYGWKIARQLSGLITFYTY